MTPDKLLQAHVAEAESLEAEFYNLGWAQGEDFVHSKTSQGRLFSQIDEKGNICHEWDTGQNCVLCGALFYGYGNNPDPVAKKGQCCDECNTTKVIPARLASIKPKCQFCRSSNIETNPIGDEVCMDCLKFQA